MNVVMTGDGGLVEVQATGERTPLSRASLDELLGLAAAGIDAAARGPARRRRARRAERAHAARPRLPQRAQGARARPAAGAERAGAACPTTSSCRPRTARRSRRTRWARRAPRPRATGETAVADDSGIEAAALGGAPGVRSARYAGEDATDEENLAKLLREVPAGRRHARGLRVRARDGAPRRRGGAWSRAAARARSRTSRAATGGFGYDPAFVPDDYDDGRTMAELSAGGEGRDQPPRPRGAGADGAGAAMIGPARAIGPQAQAPQKLRAVRVSIVSNSILIALKVAAGAITGSIAIITEAAHSSIDLIAAIVAYFGVRKADEPADESHPYGHAKIENVAAAIEGMLILVGAGVIIYEATRRLVDTPEVESLGVGIAVIAFSVVANLVVSSYLYRQARATDSPGARGRRRTPAHRRRHLRGRARGARPGAGDGRRVARPGGRAGGGRGDRGRGHPDPLAHLAGAGGRGAAAETSWRRSARRSTATPSPEVAGFHKLRARRAGSRRYIDLHVQFADGHDAAAGARAGARAAGGDQRGGARRRRADPPRARG